MTTTDMIQALIEQLRAAIGSNLDAPATIVPAALRGRAWIVRVTIGDDTYILAFDEAGATALVRALAGAEPAEADVVRMLNELCTHAANLAAGDAASDAATAPVIGDAELVDWRPGTETAVAGIACAPLGQPLVVAGGPDNRADQASTPMTPEVLAAAPPPAQGRLDVLLDIDLELVVRFGFTEMPLRALSRLGPGSLIDLSRSPEDPVEVMVGNRVIAHGEVVVVSGSYGIRVLDLVGQKDRLAGMEA